MVNIKFGFFFLAIHSASETLSLGVAVICPASRFWPPSHASLVGPQGSPFFLDEMGVAQVNAYPHVGQKYVHKMACPGNKD